MLTATYVVQHLPFFIYALLFAGAVLLPLRWALISFLLLSTIDMESSAAGIGPLNLAKGLLLPCVLLIRLRGLPATSGLKPAAWAWTGLAIYATIASAWSLFPTASLKLIGHMAGTFLIAAVWIRGAEVDAISPRAVVPVTFGIVALGLLRSAFLPSYNDEPSRFTSLTAAQSFAALVAALYCLALCARELRWSTRFLTCLTLAGVLLLNGSRIWFAGILAATVLQLLMVAIPAWLKICTAGLAVTACALLVPQMDGLARELSAEAGSNRIAAALVALYTGDSSSAGLGTMNFRKRIDSLAVSRLEKSSILELVFGHGTCNGAVITGSLFKGYASYADPNRMFHNEWLRALYEWGLIGFTLWLIFIGAIVWFAFKMSALPLLLYLPGLLVALGAENMIAGAGNAVSMGFLLLLGLAAVPQHGPTQHSATDEERQRRDFRESLATAQSWG